MLTYTIILVVVLIMTPLVLEVAAKQTKGTKRRLKVLWLLVLAVQILLGFFNWENFAIGLSGFALARDYPSSLLWFFFGSALVQFVLILLPSLAFSRLAVGLSFLNSVLIFVAMQRLSSLLGVPVVSLAAVSAVFGGLIGNVIGLAFINRDKNLFQQYPFTTLRFTHRYPLRIVLLLLALVIGYGVAYHGSLLRTYLSPDSLTAAAATQQVRDRPDVQQFLQRVPQGIVEVDHTSAEDYTVHVYEVKDGHTATFNWYRVNREGGSIVPEFDSTVGTVSGKLCYPSDRVPQGVVEAKRIADGEIFMLRHHGGDDHRSRTYDIDLEEGVYYLRYNVQGKIFGYSTTMCPTGTQHTCGDTRQRILKKVSVTSRETVTGYDLCDYYYTDRNAPQF